MPDLAVDTAALRGAPQALASVSAIADALATAHGRAMAMVPALGFPRPIHAADSFISEWAYGSGWIATQARQAGATLSTTAATYEAIEAILAASVRGSSAPTTPPVAVPAPFVEPMQPVPKFGTRFHHVPVQLATARHVTDLIPGDPDLVAELGRRLLRFADDLADARLALARVSLGSWVGAAARASMSDLEELAARLRAAESAFAEAGDAVTVYATAHADARAQATRALAMWQAAEPAAMILRGAAVGAVPPGAPADPEAVLARAGVLAREAQELMTAAGRALADRLEEAERDAPNDPGWFSRVRRAVTSFAIGTAEGVWGMGEGVIALAGLAVRTNPLRAAYDPQGYLASYEALWSAIEHGATHPKEVGAALIDLETWRDDPFRAAGKLVPDAIAIVGTAGAVGAARGAQATTRLRTVSEVVEEARSCGTLGLDPETAAARVAELGHDTSSIAGRAAATQLESVGMTVDRWVPTIFEPGQRFAFAGGSDFAVAVSSHLPTDARSFFEFQQAPPTRGILSDGTVTAPRHLEVVDVFEVRAPLEGATTMALANPQFGEGGGILAHVADLDRAVESGQLVWIKEHRFAPSTLDSRIEDPLFRWADPDLPPRALDPGNQQLRGHVEGAAKEATSSARQTAVTAGATALSDTDEGLQ